MPGLHLIAPDKSGSMRQGRERVPDQDTCLWLFTDDYTFEQLGPAEAAGHIIVIDFDDRLRPVGRRAAWAERWHSEHLFPD